MCEFWVRIEMENCACQRLTEKFGVVPKGISGNVMSYGACQKTYEGEYEDMADDRLVVVAEKFEEDVKALMINNKEKFFIFISKKLRIKSFFWYFYIIMLY